MELWTTPVAVGAVG